jgi:hydroxypyruvate isomerase
MSHNGVELMTESDWSLRYASHLGYRSPDTPLFLHLSGGLDPIAHADTASRLRFSGVQDVFAAMRSVNEQLALGQALAARGLEAGCMLYASFDVIKRPVLDALSRRRSDAFLALIEEAICVATRLQTRHVAVLVAAESGVPQTVQHDSLVENLKYAADLAETSGVVLGLEAVATKALPRMVLSNLDSVVEAVRRVDHPNAAATAG